MDPATRRLIESVHGSGRRWVLALTGGGASAAAGLLGVPGASRSVLEVCVPYDPAALADFLAFRPSQSCSAQTARALAERALERARLLAPRQPTAGLGCSASLATDRPKRGDHRVFVAVADSGRRLLYSLTLAKGVRTRQAEEALLSRLILNAVAEESGVPGRLDPELLPGEHLARHAEAIAGPLEAFFRGELRACLVCADGAVSADVASCALVVPGAFNPLHEGHRRLAEAAARLSGLAPCFELSVANVDKAALTAEEARWRLGQFRWLAPVIVSRAPTFVDKAELLPGCTFALGSDTAARLLEPRYHGGTSAGVAAALAQIRDHGCRFLVACRWLGGLHPLRLGDLSVPGDFKGLFEEIPPEVLRVDVSSTAIRVHAPAEADSPSDKSG